MAPGGQLSSWCVAKPNCRDELEEDGLSVRMYDVNDIKHKCVTMAEHRRPDQEAMAAKRDRGSWTLSGLDSEEGRGEESQLGA